MLCCELGMLRSLETKVDCTCAECCWYASRNGLVHWIGLALCCARACVVVAGSTLELRAYNCICKESERTCLDGTKAYAAMHICFDG